MAESKHETELEETEGLEQPPEKKRRHTKLRRWVSRIIALLITIVLVVGAVYVVVHRDTISIDSVRRSLSNLVNGETQADSYTLKGDTSSCTAAFQGGILVCSQTDLQLFARSGKQEINESINFTKPVVSAAGHYAAVYDAGGSRLYLIRDEQIVHTYTSDKAGAILSARVNENGSLTVVERATGYKAAVTVYDAGLQPVVTENISSSFVSDAALSPDGKTLAAVSVGEDTSGFDSVLIFYNVADGEELYRCALGSDVLLDLKWEKNGLWVVGEYGAYYVEKGTLTNSNTDQTRILQDFSLGGNGFAVLYCSKYQNGSGGTVELLTTQGSGSAISQNDEVLDLSAAGSYFSVLTANQLTIYRSDMTVYAQVDNDWGARKVLQREDGSVLVVSNGSADLYAPE